MHSFTIGTSEGNKVLDDYPNICPICHQTIMPNMMKGHIVDNQTIHMFFSCPNKDCHKAFIGEYKRIGGNVKYSYKGLVTHTIVKETFSQTISDISLNFIEIYNQSFYAEQNNLLEICGVGYRKALEFLIKEYTIKNHPAEKEKIEKKLLGAVINEYVNDSRIQAVAKRAAWLGNDETHYIKKWEGKTLADLKKLIDLTVHWIEMEELTESFKEEMPE